MKGRRHAPTRSPRFRPRPAVAASASCGSPGRPCRRSPRPCSGACRNPAAPSCTPSSTSSGAPIDQGHRALSFRGLTRSPARTCWNSHGHGGPVVLDLLLQRLLGLGARLATPGEFTQRAFLNDKLDLAQAEAIADLIDSGSAQAARAALRSLQGEFSARVHELAERVLELRMWIEAAIDFPEEEIDFLADRALGERMDDLRRRFGELAETARQGSLLRDGLTVVIAGRPNAGKSSLLNRLAGYDAAIVTATPRHDSRRAARADRHRRPAAARAGHGRTAGFRGRGRSRGHPSGARGNLPGGPGVVRRRFCRRRGDPRHRGGPGPSAGGRPADAGLQQDRPERRGASGRVGRRRAGAGVPLRGDRGGARGPAPAPEGLHRLPPVVGRGALRPHAPHRRAAPRARPRRSRRTGCWSNGTRANSWRRSCATRTRRSARSPARSRATTCSAGSSRASA